MDVTPKKEHWNKKNPDRARKARNAYVAKNRAKHNEACRRQAYKTKYGITYEQVQAKVAAQLGRCAICGEVMQKPNVDHCHKSGRVRGMLCQLCNRGIGLFRENTRHLESAIRYLEYWSGEIQDRT